MQDPKIPASHQALTVADSIHTLAPLMVSSPKAEADAEAGAVNMHGLLHALRRRWLLAGCLAVMGACLAVLGVIQLMPAQFVAVTRVQVAYRAANPLLHQTPWNEPDFVVYKAYVAAQVKSRSVIAAALPEIKDLPMIRSMERPIDELEKSLKTDYTEAPTILKISLGGEQPEQVTKVVNAITTAFINQVSSEERTRYLGRLEKLKESHRREINALQEKQARLRNLEIANNIEDELSAKSKYDAALAAVGIAKKAELDNRLLQLKTQEEFRSAEEIANNIDKLPLPTSLVDERMVQDPRGQALFLNLALIEKTIQEYKASVKRPLLDSLLAQEQQKKVAAERAVADLREQLRPELERFVRDKMRDDARINVTKLREEMAYLKKHEVALADEVRRVEAAAVRMSPAGRQQPQDVMALRENIKNTQAAFAELEKTIRALEIEPGQESRISLLQTAEVPEMRDRSRQMKIGVVAAFGIFGLALFGVSWLEFNTRKISAADEVVRGAGMNLVGTLPSIPAKARKPVNGKTTVRINCLRNQLAESVDAIRTMLLHSARTDALRVIMITSAEGGEGKTSVASQLASSLARAWRKTLLIDGDLRNPEVHKLFETPQEPGFSEVLRGEVTTADAVRTTAISRLWVMPAGHWDAHAVQALAQDGVSALFKQLKEEFDFIVVDSSPVLPVNDSLMLGQHVDGVIFSVLRDVSRMPTLQTAKTKLGSVGVRTLGAVVIGEQNSGANLAYQYGGNPS